MKNLSLIISGILAALVIYLFVEVQSLKKGKQETTPTEENDVVLKDNISFPIAFVDLDSLTEKLDFYKENKKVLEKKFGTRQRNLAAEAQALESEKNSRMQDIQSGAGRFFKTQDQAAYWQQNFQERALEFQQKEYTLQQEMSVSTMKVNNEGNDLLNNFLKEYQKKLNYKYILPKSSQLSLMLYADSTLDLTNEVLAGLNASYNKDSVENTVSTETK